MLRYCEAGDHMVPEDQFIGNQCVDCVAEIDHDIAELELQLAAQHLDKTEDCKDVDVLQ